jgi:hypothetical protein
MQSHSYESRPHAHCLASSGLGCLVLGSTGCRFFPVLCHAWRTPSTHPRYSKNGGCPTSPSGHIKWQPPLGGDSSTCTGSVLGTTATIQYFQSNYDAVLGVSTKVTVPGNVGGWPVRWYVTTSDNGQLRRDAILPDSDNKPTVHISVTADSASDLAAAMKVVEQLKL